MPQTEAFARTLINAQIKDQGWKISDGTFDALLARCFKPDAFTEAGSIA